MKKNIVQEKPFKKYLFEVEGDLDLKEFIKFLKSNIDKKIGITLNSKYILFTSLTSQQKFIEGLEKGYSVGYERSKKLFKKMQQEINDLKSQLGQFKHQQENFDKEKRTLVESIRRQKFEFKVRNDAYKDLVAELQDDRRILKDQIDRIKK